MCCSRALGQEAGSGGKVVSPVSTCSVAHMGTRKENFHFREYHTHPTYVKQERWAMQKQSWAQTRNKIT